MFRVFCLDFLVGTRIEKHESFQIFGCEKGVYSEVERRWNADYRDLSEGRDYSGDIFQLAYRSDAAPLVRARSVGYAGLLPNEMRRLKTLEDGNGRLKKIVADLVLDREMLQDHPT